MTSTIDPTNIGKPSPRRRHVRSLTGEHFPRDLHCPLCASMKGASTSAYNILCANRGYGRVKRGPFYASYPPPGLYEVRAKTRVNRSNTDHREQTFQGLATPPLYIARRRVKVICNRIVALYTNVLGGIDRYPSSS